MTSVLAALPALAVGIIGGGGEKGPTQPAAPLTFTAVSAGGTHTCAVTAAGTAYCWGDNPSGQLGNGTTTQRSSPVPVKGGVTFAAVSAGGDHTCGVTAAGAAYCWGVNGQGRLGDGTTTDRSSPALVTGGVRFAAVSAGGFHTCGVTTAGAGYCWGYNGGGTETMRSSPVPVAGGVSFTAVSAGLGHTCALTAAGAAYCWGFNKYGQLGDGTTTGRLTPVLVGGVAHAVTGGGEKGPTQPTLRFAAVSAGGFHTCALTAAGAAYCWGANFSSQLGNGAPGPDSTAPIRVAGGLSFAAVSAGAAYTCALTDAGAAYCWGANESGQLGDGTTTNRSSPVAVAGDLSFGAVSAGWGHTCGVTATGVAYCWGGNGGNGQLGDGTTSDRLRPVPVAGGVRFSAVSAGSAHTCGVTTAGAAYCWGYNFAGRLGNDAPGPEFCGPSKRWCSTVPVLVAGGVRFAAVSAGDLHTCGVTPAGAAYCWAGNSLRPDGTMTEESRPLLVPGGVRFAAVSAGGDAGHTCGVTAAGAAYCWGLNAWGELGDGTMTSRSSPVLVAGGVSFAAAQRRQQPHLRGHGGGRRLLLGLK